MKSVFSIVLLLAFTSPLYSLKIQEKVRQFQRFRTVETLIGRQLYNQASDILIEIKALFPDSELKTLSNYYLADIEYRQNRFYPASFFIGLSLNDSKIINLHRQFQEKIYYLAGMIYDRIEDYPSSLKNLNQALELSDHLKSMIHLKIGEITARKLKNPEKAFFHLKNIKKSDLNDEQTGLYRFLTDKYLWMQINTAAWGYHDPNVSAVAADKDNLFIGLYNGSLIRFNYILNEKEFYPPPMIVSETVRDLHLRDRYLYIGTTEGLTVYDKRNGAFFQPEQPQKLSVTSITSDSRGIFIGTLENGIFFMNPSSGKLEPYVSLGPVSWIYALDNRLYASTYAGRFYQITADGPQIVKGSHRLKSPVTGMIKNGDEIWVSTYGSGIYRMDEKRGFYHNYTRENSALTDNFCLCITLYQNTIYAGTLGYGINIFNKSESVWKKMEVNDYYEGSDIKSILFHDGWMFIATLGEGVLVKYLIDPL